MAKQFEKTPAWAWDPAVVDLVGIGGGMTRDVLLPEIPIVLRADLYAVAALAGAAVVVIGASRLAGQRLYIKAIPSTVPCGAIGGSEPRAAAKGS